MRVWWEELDPTYTNTRLHSPERQRATRGHRHALCLAARASVLGHFLLAKLQTWQRLSA